jgi:ribosomal protein S18 acetylase RimI-like enzyme
VVSLSSRQPYPYSPPPVRLSSAAPVQIASLTSDHILAFRALRLDALRHHPEAFVPTYEEERDVDPATIAARFRHDWLSDGSFLLGAFHDGRLVGAVGVRRWTRQKQRHRATMWILYTDPLVRGLGVGHELLRQGIARCQAHPEIEILTLSVSTESTAARRLYRDAGFQVCGIEPKAIRLPDRYVDVEQMALDL